MENVREELLAEINFILNTVENMIEVDRLLMANDHLNPAYTLINFGYNSKILDEDEYLYYLKKANDLFCDIIDKDHDIID